MHGSSEPTPPRGATSSPSGESTIHQKLRFVFTGDNETLSDAVLNAVHRQPKAVLVKSEGDDPSLSQFELDCLQWGCVFGVAFALLFGENSWEAPADVARRAEAAATELWREWAGGDWNERKLDEKVQAVVLEFDRIRSEGSGDLERLPLGDALIDLKNTAGAQGGSAVT